MDLDIRTISVLAAVAYILQTFAIAFLYIKNKKYPGILWWALGTAATAIGVLLLLARDFTQSALISIILPNALIVAGALFIYVGIMRFLERREKQGLVFSVFAVFILLYFYFTYITDDINSRTVIVSVALIFYLFLTVQALLEKTPKTITATSHFIAVILFSEACFFVFRTYSVLTFAPVNSLFTPTLIQTMVFGVYFVVGILLTFGLIFMVNQRLHAEVTAAKDHFELLFDSNPDGSAIHEIVYGTSGEPIEYLLLDVNPAFEHILGLKRENVIGKTSKEAYGVDTPPYFETYSRVAETGQAVEFESFFAPMKKHFHILTYSPEHGKFATIFEDITDQKEAEEHVKRLLEEVQSEKNHLSSLIASISDEIWFADADKKFTLANPAAIREFGAGSDTINVEKLAASLEVLRPDGSPRPIDEAPPLRALRGELVRNQEELVRTPGTGELRWRQVNANPVRDVSGNIIGAVSVVRDITDVKIAEKEILQKNEELNVINEELTSTQEELHQTNDVLLANEHQLVQKNDELIALNVELSKLAAIVENSDDAIIGKSLNGTILSWNAGAEKIYGYSESEVLGKNVSILLPPSHLDDMEFILRSSETETRVKHYETQRIKKDGTLIHVSLTLSPIRDRTGKIIGASTIARDITESKQVEEKMQNTLQRFYHILSNMQYGVLLVTNENRVEFANQRFCDLFSLNDSPAALMGISQKEMLEKIRHSYVDPDDALAHIREIVRLGKTVFGEDVKMQGKQVLLRDFVPICLGGKVFGRLWIHRDITERKNLEETLRESEERYRAFFESSVDAILITAPDGSVEAANPEACRMFGLTEEEFIRGGRDAVVIPSDPRLMEALDIRARTGRFRGELNFRRKDGTIFPADDSTVLFTDRNGKTKTVTAIRDISERKHAEEALRASEEKYRNLFANMTEEVHFWHLIRDSNGRIRTWRLVDANPPTLKTWGKTREEILGKTTDEIFGPGATEHYMPVVQKIMTEGVPYSFVDYFPNLDKYFRFTSVPLGNYFITTGADITEIKKAEDEVKRKNENLNALNEELTEVQEELHQNLEELSLREQELVRSESDLKEALSEKEALLSEIHHRVKNNLTAFISLLSLEGSYEDTESGRALRKDLQNRARSMALIHETLYRTGKFSKVDMSIYLKNLVDQIAQSYGMRSDVHVGVEVNGTLSIDRATTAGLIINELVTNSFKYAFPPEFDCIKIRNEQCTIRVSLANEDGTDVLRVSDNGCGFREGFDPLTSKSLGLKLVNFLSRHQLRADIEVRSNIGTEFIFRLKNDEDDT
jgi:PAS domain S-box-containing protein